MKIRNSNFNIQQIADSGQCFRMNKIEENKYNLVAYNTYLELIQEDEETIELSCSEKEYIHVWKDYFHLEYDYNHVVQTLVDGNDEFLKEAAMFGKGIRILRQEPFEAMISYIISQNKNIPAIKNCIEAICREYGKPIVTVEGTTYYTFPTPKSLVDAKPEDLRNLKIGYRDKYIISAAKAVANGTVDLELLKKYDSKKALEALKSIHGIGEKVANCILLYGLHHVEVFPIDVWIKRVLCEIYNDEFNPMKYEGYAGIVQQYMFYYMRNQIQDSKK